MIENSYNFLIENTETNLQELYKILQSKLNSESLFLGLINLH